MRRHWINESGSGGKKEAGRKVEQKRVDGRKERMAGKRKRKADCPGWLTSVLSVGQE